MSNPITDHSARNVCRDEAPAPTAAPSPHSSSPHSSSAFDPPPHITKQILNDYHNGATLRTIADKAGIDIEDLCLFLARPDIAARIDAVESTLRRRARLQVIDFAPNIFETCATIITRYNEAPDRGPEDRNDPTTHAIHTRNASNALMAARVMLHMARYLDDDLPKRGTSSESLSHKREVPSRALNPRANKLSRTNLATPGSSARRHQIQRLPRALARPQPTRLYEPFARAKAGRRPTHRLAIARVFASAFVFTRAFAFAFHP